MSAANRFPVIPSEAGERNAVARQLRRLLQRIENAYRRGERTVILAMDIQALQDAVDILEGN